MCKSVDYGRGEEYDGRERIFCLRGIGVIKAFGG